MGSSALPLRFAGSWHGAILRSMVGKAILPDFVRQTARQARRHVRAELSLRRSLRSGDPSRYRSRRSGPCPPNAVIAATSLLTWDELDYKSSPYIFITTGKQEMAQSVDLATTAGLELSGATSALEIGSGGARLIRHLRRVRGLRLIGCDLLDENIDWCQEHLPGIEFHRNELEPPLTFAEDGTFDFVFAYSVFTHIPMPMQGPWIGEVARVLKPGGVAVVTVLGDDSAKKMLAPGDYQRFVADGEYTMDPDHPRVSASSAHIGSWDVFMTEARLRKLYGGALEIVSYGSGFQVPVVLRRAS